MIYEELYQMIEDVIQWRHNVYTTYSDQGVRDWADEKLINAKRILDDVIDRINKLDSEG